MKKNIGKLLGIAALVAVIGLGLAGCPTDSGGGGGGGGGSVPAQYQNTTWTRNPIIPNYNERKKLEIGTGSIKLTYEDDTTEIWTIDDEHNEKEVEGVPYRVFGLLDENDNYGNLLYLKADGTGVFFMTDADWIKQ